MSPVSEENNSPSSITETNPSTTNPTLATEPSVMISTGISPRTAAVESSSGDSSPSQNNGANGDDFKHFLPILTPCPTSYKPVAGKCLLSSENIFTWSQAQEFCRSQFGHLITFKDLPDMLAVLREFNQIGKNTVKLKKKRNFLNCIFGSTRCNSN